jgi:hypothetical protein
VSSTTTNHHVTPGAGEQVDVPRPTGGDVLTGRAPSPAVFAQWVTKPSASVVLIDPETATRWLVHNEVNRHLRVAQVTKYASDMAAGRWHLTGSPIQFAVDGRLLDGQHRLAAIVKSGVTLPMFVVRGLASTAQSYMDTGAKRTVADQLSIAGYKNSSVLAAGARLALAWWMGRLGQPRDAVSDPETRAFIQAHPGLIEAAAFATQMRRAGLDIHPSVSCAARWGLTESGHDPQRVEGFFRALAEMRSTGPGDPKYALLHRINTARRNRERIVSADMLSMLIRAYNADYTGKKARRIQVFAHGSAIDVPQIVRPDARRERSQHL